MTDSPTTFNLLWDKALTVVREAGGPRQEDIATALGVSRSALQVARKKPRSLGYDTVRKFCDDYLPDKKLARAIRWAWIEERMIAADIGAATSAFLKYCRGRFDSDEMERVQDIAREAFEATQ